MNEATRDAATSLTAISILFLILEAIMKAITMLLPKESHLYIIHLTAIVLSEFFATLTLFLIELILSFH